MQKIRLLWIIFEKEVNMTGVQNDIYLFICLFIYLFIYQFSVWDSKSKENQIQTKIEKANKIEHDQKIWYLLLQENYERYLFKVFWSPLMSSPNNENFLIFANILWQFKWQLLYKGFYPYYIRVWRYICPLYIFCCNSWKIGPFTMIFLHFSWNLIQTNFQKYWFVLSGNRFLLNILRMTRQSLYSILISNLYFSQFFFRFIFIL